MSKNILITGATGLVGTRLTALLLQKGYRVAHLGRSKRQGTVQSFQWDVEKGEIDSEALKGIDSIVHLAGAGVADKRWTPSRKKEILDSRVKSSALLFQQLKLANHSVRSFLSASAIGLYGLGAAEEIFSEERPSGNDFLARVTKQWEEEVSKIETLGIRTVKLRIGIVLSDLGGALPQMAAPIRWGVGAALGTGKQYLPWIHLDDLCEMFIKAIEDDKMQGPYNATGMDGCTNLEMTNLIAKVLNKPLWLPPIPGFVLKILLGEMAEVVLNGSKVSSAKIQRAGFTFKHTLLEPALRDLLLR